MKMSAVSLFIVLAIIAGALIPIQTSMYAQLGKSLQSPLYSALAVFIIAALGVFMFIVFSSSHTPSVKFFTSEPKWSYSVVLLAAYMF